MSHKLSDAVMFPTTQRTLDFGVSKDGIFAQTVQKHLLFDKKCMHFCSCTLLLCLCIKFM